MDQAVEERMNTGDGTAGPVTAGLKLTLLVKYFLIQGTLLYTHT